jgi:outer membrane biosynthesis protein TonB
MTISPGGKIIKAEKVSTTLNYSSLENAIIKRIYKWRFPPIKNAVDYKITYTFDFSPLG